MFPKRAKLRRCRRRHFLARVEPLEARLLLAIDLQNFDGATVPLNGDGETYPSSYGAQFVATINGTDAVSGNSLQLAVQDVAGTTNSLYAQFNPYNYEAGNGLYDNLPQRAFARDYAIDSGSWQFDTINRMAFWIK